MLRDVVDAERDDVGVLLLKAGDLQVGDDGSVCCRFSDLLVFVDTSVHQDGVEVRPDVDSVVGDVDGLDEAERVDVEVLVLVVPVDDSSRFQRPRADGVQQLGGLNRVDGELSGLKLVPRTQACAADPAATASGGSRPGC